MRWQDNANQGEDNVEPLHGSFSIGLCCRGARAPHKGIEAMASANWALVRADVHIMDRPSDFGVAGDLGFRAARQLAEQKVASTHVSHARGARHGASARRPLTKAIAHWRSGRRRSELWDADETGFSAGHFSGSRASVVNLTFLSLGWHARGRNFKFENHTRNISLLVQLLNTKFALRVAPR